MFKVGDVVTLKSGGLSMTVCTAEEMGVTCIWFAGKDIATRQFDPETLIKVEPEPVRVIKVDL